MTPRKGGSDPLRKNSGRRHTPISIPFLLFGIHSPSLTQTWWGSDEKLGLLEELFTPLGTEWVFWPYCESCLVGHSFKKHFMAALIATNTQRLPPHRAALHTPGMGKILNAQYGLRDAQTPFSEQSSPAIVITPK